MDLEDAIKSLENWEQMQEHEKARWLIKAIIIRDSLFLIDLLQVKLPKDKETEKELEKINELYNKILYYGSSLTPNDGLAWEIWRKFQRGENG